MSKRTINCMTTQKKKKKKTRQETALHSSFFITDGYPTKTDTQLNHERNSLGNWRKGGFFLNHGMLLKWTKGKNEFFNEYRTLPGKTTGKRNGKRERRRRRIPSLAQMSVSRQGFEPEDSPIPTSYALETDRMGSTPTKKGAEILGERESSLYCNCKRTRSKRAEEAQETLPCQQIWILNL